MIPLKIQVYTIIFSFLFGMFFFFLINLNYKFIYSKNKFIKIFSTMLIIVISVIIYFIGIMKISYGVFHIYSLLCILVSYVVLSYLTSIAKNKRK